MIAATKAMSLGICFLAAPKKRSIAGIPEQMRTEGEAIVAGLRTGGFTAEPDEEIVALIAYLQRLGKDGTAAISAGASKAATP